MKTSAGVAAALVLAVLSQEAGARDPGFYVGIDAGQSQRDLDGPFPVIPMQAVAGYSEDDRDTAFGLHVGYTVSPRFAVEFAYMDAGEVQTTLDTLVPDFFGGLYPGPITDLPITGVPIIGFVSIDPEFDLITPFPPRVSVLQRREQTFETKVLSLSVLGHLPLSESVRLTGKVGLAAQKMDLNLRVWLGDPQATVIRAHDEDSSGAAIVGLGGEWLATSHLSLRVHAAKHFLLEDNDAGNMPGDIILYTAGVSWHF